MRLCLAPFGLSFLATAAGACAQRVILELRGEPGQQFGSAVAGTGDVDLDGWPDLLVGAPAGAGLVQLRSGRDGRVLHTFAGGPGMAAGRLVEGLGDVDRDGHPDLLYATATATVIARADGTVLWRLPAADLAKAIGDADGDGHADAVLGMFTGGANGGGAVQVFSGRTGLALHTHDVEPGHGLISLCGAGDVDADGAGDFIFAVRRELSSTVHVVSPKRQMLLWQWTTTPGSGLIVGSAVACAGDFDGDGHGDIAFATHEETQVPPPYRTGGKIEVRSGREGTVLQVVSGYYAYREHPTMNDGYYLRYGGPICGGGDIDGDGSDDLLVHEASSHAPARLRVLGGDIVNAPDPFVLLRPYDGPTVFCGDVDRDGFDDFAVGAPSADSVTVYAGPGRTRVAQHGIPPWTSAPRGTARHLAMASADVDGDGVRDVITATRCWDPSTNQMLHNASAVSGRDGVSPLGGVGMVSYGTLAATLAPIRDLDRDGRIDWAVTWAGSSIQVWRSSLGTLALPLSHPSATALAGGADWNGDQVGEVFVGVPGAKAGSGVVEVYSGSDGTLLTTFTGAEGGFGTAVLPAGDVDRDGIGDFIVSAPRADRGVVQLLLARGTQIAWTIAMAVEHLVGIADEDADGKRDFAVMVAYSCGYDIQVHSGASGALIRHVGLPVAPAPIFDGGTDVDGDGLADYVVGDPLRARLVVISGAAGRVLGEHLGYRDGFGDHVAWIGSADGVTHVAAMSESGGSAFSGYLQVLRDDSEFARAVPYGHGCRDAAAPMPRMVAREWPALAGMLSLEIVPVPPHAPSLLLMSTAEFAGGLALAPLGWPACVQWVAPEMVVPFVSGRWMLTVPWHIPAVKAFRGLRLFAQHLALDFSVQPARLVASNGLRLRVDR